METRGIKRGMDMNKKVMALAGLVVALAAIGYAIYNSFSQLQNIDYDLFETDDEEDED
jgi:uncharacterized membrane protein YebE (DUF533 family)